MKWWTALQPSWRQKLVDGALATNIPADEKWEGLSKGGTAGIYTVIVALSWWIKVVPATADGDAWVAVRDVAWVMGRICATLGSANKSRGLKREGDNLSDGRRRSKRSVSLTCMHF
jgi:hypothetical protein